MNIAFFTPYFGFGGLEKICLQTFKYFLDEGHNVYHFSTTYELEDRLNHENYHYLELPDNTRGESLQNELEMIQHINRLDISHLICAVMSPFVFVNIKNKTNVRLIYWTHTKPLWEVDKMSSSIDLILSKYHIGFENSLCDIIKKFLLYRKKKKEIQRLKDCLSLCDNFIVLSPVDIERLIEITQLKIYKHKVTYFVNGLEINPCPVIQKENVIIFAGRLSFHDKRLDRLIDIWGHIYKKLPEWTLEIYGDGWYKNKYEEQARKYERCFFKGRLENMQEAYDKASIVCLTSQFEGWGLILSEGQNNGCIPVSFNCCGGVEYIIGKKNQYGRIIPCYDKKRYAEALLELCTNEVLLRQLQESVLKKRYDYEIKKSFEQWRLIIK